MRISKFRVSKIHYEDELVYSFILIKNKEIFSLKTILSQLMIMTRKTEEVSIAEY